MAVTKRICSVLATLSLTVMLLTGCASGAWPATMMEAAQALTSGVIRAEILAQLYLILCASLAVNAAFFLCALFLLVRRLWKSKKSKHTQAEPKQQESVEVIAQVEPSPVICTDAMMQEQQEPTVVSEQEEGLAQQPVAEKKHRRDKPKNKKAHTQSEPKLRSSDRKIKKPKDRWLLFQRGNQKKKEAAGMKVPAFFAQFPQVEGR